MRTAPPLKHGYSASQITQRTTTVCVVDPAVNDYDACLSTADARVRVRVVASAEVALRLARTTAIDLWIVNTSLPGISGFELCSMLKSRSNGHKIHLVADSYSIADEQEAWRSRATLFACKSAHLGWLCDWLRQGDSISPPLPSAANS